MLQNLFPHYPNLDSKGKKIPDHYEGGGFHFPIDCPSDNHKDYQNSNEDGKDRFYQSGHSEETYAWCSKCIVNKN